MVLQSSYWSEKKQSYHKGAFNNYVDRKGWVGGQLNVYAISEMTSIYLLRLSTRALEGWVGGRKSSKFCLRSYWMSPLVRPGDMTLLGKTSLNQNSVIEVLCPSIFAWKTNYPFHWSFEWGEFIRNGFFLEYDADGILLSFFEND